MTKQRFVYAIYIAAPAEKIFAALTDGPTTREYWFHEQVGEWKVGGQWSHRRLDGSGDDGGGTVLEYDPPRRLVLTWGDNDQRGDLSTHTRVTFELEPVAGSTKLTVIHDDLPPEMVADVTGGWSSVLSSLKSLMETGKSLGDLWGR